MNTFEISNQCFNVASVVYAFAFFFYCALLTSNKKWVDAGATALGRAGWTMHTAALIFRWIHAGIAHPPWTNLYESLVFFSWGCMTIHLFLEWRRDFKISGVFATAVTFVAMGIASLHPHKEIEPLVPALQSWWLLFHVFMATLAYAFFMASSFVSVFYLLKEKVKVEKMAAFAGLVCILFLAIAAGKSFFLQGKLLFFKVSQMEGREVIMDFKGPDGRPMQEFVSLSGGAVWIGLLLLGYALSSALLGLGKKRQALGRRFWWMTTVAHGVFILWIAICIQRTTGMAMKSNPYKIAAVLMTFGLGVLFSALFRILDRVLKKLPASEVLDRWGYEAILFGVPFMTLNLVSGAVWAYYAWGRYWGWDPKETWALITWFTYVGYLHMRILGGWKGKKTAVLSVIGFFVVVFTYLGVNLVISGLHSYATG